MCGTFFMMGVKYNKRQWLHHKKSLANSQGFPFVLKNLMGCEPFLNL